MLLLTGNIGQPQLERIELAIPHVGMLLMPHSWRTPICPYALDNGVYGAWCQGRVWDQQMHDDWLKMLGKVPADRPPLWVLLPDAVADWPRTVELARLYLPVIRAHGWPVAIALQDGCDFEQVLEFEPEWVFVAGSTEWKEANIDPVCRFFHPRGVKVHVGRVSSRRRIMICQAAGVDSVDSTAFGKREKKILRLVSDTLKQPCLMF